MTQKERPQWLEDVLQFFEQTKLEDVNFQNLPASFHEVYNNEDSEILLAMGLLGVVAQVYEFEPYEEDYAEALPGIVVCMGIESAAWLIDLPVRKVDGMLPLAKALSEWRESFQLYEFQGIVDT